ncbi:MAG: hypothetical protein JEZ11_08915 [Desulfobacterales bacterium]|nr:hypothetical protein [Desulfobacterales bacterium]
MKRVLCYWFIMMVAITANGYALTQKLTFDIVEGQYKVYKGLIEVPSGELKVNVKIPDEIAEKDDVRKFALLLQQAPPVVDKAREEISKELKIAVDKIGTILVEAKKMSDSDAIKAQAYMNKGFDKINDHLNVFYKKKARETAKAVQQAINAKWSQLQKRQSSYKKFKLKKKLALAKGTFKVATNTLRIVASGGMDVTAIANLVHGIYGLYKNLDALAKGEEKARKDLNKMVANLKKRLEKGGAKKLLNKLTNPYPIKSLQTEITTYNAKLIPFGDQADKTAREIAKLLDAQESIKSDKGRYKALVKETAKLLENIDGLNDQINLGEKLLTEAEDLVDVAKKKQSRAANAIDEADDVIRTIMDLNSTRKMINATGGLSILKNIASILS